MGPITLFDKSFLQALNTDESVWFDYYFYPVIAPLFYIETLADLEKAPREGKSAEDEVGIIAAKTPQLSGAPCYFHGDMVKQDLLGNHVPMTGVIPRAGIEMVMHEGELSGIAKESQEALAFSRWQRGKFREVERNYARNWRSYLNSIDLPAIESAMKRVGINPKTCTSIEAAHKLAVDAVNVLHKSVGRFDGALSILQLSPRLCLEIKKRWKRTGKRPFHSFAPYASHVLTVELFFRIAIGAGLIASTRASNRVDMAYLFYLPFCSVFISADKLHKLCAPLFLRDDQTFVWGLDVKPELSVIDAHFKTLPEEVRMKGIYKFAQGLPDCSKGKIRDLYNKYLRSDGNRQVDKKALSAEAHAKLIAKVNALSSAKASSPRIGNSNYDMNSLVIERIVSITKGSWVQIAPEEDETEQQKSVNADTAAKPR